MINVCPGGPLVGFRKGAFTLIEIVVAMTIIAVIAAVAVPTLKGLNDDEKARAPLTALAAMVQEVRLRAMREHRPYEIVIERDGLHAIPGNRSFSGRDEFLKHLEELRTPPPVTRFDQVVPEKAAVEKVERAPMPGMKAMPEKPEAEKLPDDELKVPELPWTQTIALEGGMRAEVLLWGDGEWEAVEGDVLRRWVFQQSGMASPAGVRLVKGSAELEGQFDVLTGEMTRERLRSKTPLLQ